MDELKPGNLTPIKGGRKVKQQQEKTSDDSGRLKTAEVYKILADLIHRRPWVDLPPFPVRYSMIEPERGTRLPVVIAEDDSVTIVSADALASDILTYCDRQLAGRSEYALKPSQATEAAKYFLMTGDPIPAKDIRATRWQGESGFTYRRLPWELKVGEAPTWERLLSRMSNAQAFIDWVGSLFDDASSLHNYVWLYGIGGDGKGSINRFLESVFGTAYRSKQTPGDGKFRDKFWTFGLLGARLVVFPDCNDHKFVSGGLFKSLTGGDPVDAEAKGKMSFTVRLNAKYLVISNEKPSISSEKADMRRIIYCELGTCNEVDPEFEARLWEEGGAFLSTCVAQYAEKYPTHGPIATDTSAIADWVSTVEEPYEEVFNTWFEVDPDAHVMPVYMQAVLCSEWRSKPARLEFAKWLEKTHGVRKKTVRVVDKTPKGYVGIKLKKIPPLVRKDDLCTSTLNNEDTSLDMLNT